MNADDAYDRGFRCCRCGATRLIDGVDPGFLWVRESRGATGPACERCGAIVWVRMFSTTEFYAFWSRADVCRVGEHVAQGVRTYRMSQPGSGPEGAATIQVMVQACPEHAPLLRQGWDGWQLDDEALDP